MVNTIFGSNRETVFILKLAGYPEAVKANQLYSSTEVPI